MTDDMSSTMPPRISLLLSDVDGTLVTPEKQVTPRTVEAVHRLREAGIAFAITSSRPPAGLARIVETLGIATPVAGFNGGMIVDPSGTPIRTHALDVDSARRTVALLEERGIDTWVFQGNEWLITNPEGTYVPLERKTIGYDATPVRHFIPHLEGVTKIVASGADPAPLKTAETELRGALGHRASVSMSQTYYLDITSALANKGQAVLALSEILLIPPEEIATIGDGENDIRMFEVSGYSIAMGNAAPGVKARARTVTGRNDADGWAEAVLRHILPHAPKTAAPAA